MKRHLLPLPCLFFSACAAVAPLESADEDHGRDSVVALTSADDIESELASSPLHQADAPFARLSYLVRSPEPRTIEIQTSRDGEIWSEWSTGVLSEEASDEEFGVWVSDLDVVDGEALYYRVRATESAQPPTELALQTETLDELAEDALEDAAPEFVEGEPGVSGAVAELTSFRRYRYDLGRVGRSWLYLLRGARSRGWRGSLYGARTGLRTYAQQASLWNAYQNGTGAPAFPPWGPSRHMYNNVRRVATWYQAVDTNDVPNLIRIARGMGVSLHLPYAAREPWHVEATRSFGPPRGWTP